MKTPNDIKSWVDMLLSRRPNVEDRNHLEAIKFYMDKVDNEYDECRAGYWDFNGYTHYCSCCGKDAETDENGMEILDDYCPHCNAEMVEQ